MLRRGHVVSADAAIDVLWPVDPPRDPVAALHNHLFRLRRGLPDDVVESVGNGYRLAPEAVELDADLLVATLNAATTADPESAQVIGSVLERWVGPAYPELDDVDDGRAEAVRLARPQDPGVLEARAERRLEAGDSDGLVAELAALVDEEPLRERPRALLMAALAASGRHVEALRVYDDFRRLLGDELGIEPSPTLAAQHAELLRGTDPPAWTPASRLPVPVTSLVGRDGLVDDVVAMADAHRLVSLTGPGGVGKTRLLGEVGLRLPATRADRPVVMCELATASEESAVDVVAAALAIEGRPGVGLTERVVAVLDDTEIVLLLDNCEHVLEPIAQLVEHALATCPHVRVVTTSRERLRVPGEQVCVVPALPCADDDAPAVRLFVERARAVAPSFTPDPAELAVVTEIVRRLDGLPLAIELAAARLHTLDVAEVAAGLDRRFLLLSAGYRTSARHGSLGAAMSWSFALLDADLQRMLADLSVFAGPFDVAGVATVCDVDMAAAAVALDQLVERSLVMRTTERRYVLLETVRAFGAEQLADAGWAAETCARHAGYSVEWVEAAERRILDPAHPAALTEIDAALPELRSALGWLLDHDEVDLAGRLVAALLDYGFLRLRPDVLAWADRVAEADPDDRATLAPVVRAVGGYGRWMAGDIAGVGERTARALDVSLRRGEPVAAEVLTLRGSYELFEGRLEESAAWFRRASDAAGGDRAQRILATSTGVLSLAYAGDPAAVDATTDVLAEVGDAPTPYAAWAWYCAGEADLSVDVDRAHARLARALEMAELTGASFVAGVAGASKASIEARLGDPFAAAEDYRRLITHWRRAGMWATQWTMLRSIAGLLARLGRPRDAAVLEGAVRTTDAGHRIFGEDEVVLAELGARLRSELGDDAYDAARREGAALDGDAAVEHALRAL